MRSSYDARNRKVLPKRTQPVNYFRHPSHAAPCYPAPTVSQPPGPLGEQSTDAVVAEPWPTETGGSREPELHLVIVWFLDEPHRVGQVARLEPPCWLGRFHPDFEKEPPLQFFEQRPGESLATADLQTTKVSRRQLRFTRVEGEGAGRARPQVRVHVENVGRRELFVNGRPAREAVVQAGDTLMLEHTAVFLLEERPLAIPAMGHYRSAGFGFGAADAQGMVGESPEAWRLRDELAGAARAETHVLLLGETGAGKEVAARVVHGLSARARGPLVARNAATIPGSLLDAELFGCARNFPNAGSPERVGLVEAASGGYLMLDEIGELGEEQQAHLLRVLDSHGSYHRLGETQRARVSDFRLIAATNRHPGTLKHDFLARFADRVHVPGLNERRSDIPLLLAELVRRAARATPELVAPFLEEGDADRPRVEARLMDALVRHRYTEHTRELMRLLQVALKTSRQVFLELTPEVEQALAAASVTRGDDTVEAEALDRAALDRAALDRPAETGASGVREARASDRPSAPPGPSAEEVTRALEVAGGSVQLAAEQLGVSRYKLYRLIKSHGLVRKFDASG